MPKARVLFIDDEAEFVKVVSERLRSRGIDVDVAFNGPDGIAMARQVTYDAILLDLSMPGMDGLETMRLLLEHDPQMQVIILTGHGSIAAGVDAIKHGAADFVEKPADIDTLIDKFSSAQQARLALFEKNLSQKMSDLTRRKGW